MSRRLMPVLVILTLVLVTAGCGPLTIVMPGATAPTAAPAATPAAAAATATPPQPSPTASATALPPATATTAPATATPTKVPITATPTAVAPTATPTNAPVKPLVTVGPGLPLPVLRPDLFISEMSLDPASPHIGEAVSVRVGVYNDGSAVSSPFRVEWWSSSAVKACDWTVNSLASKGGRILTCAYTYASWSTYTVRAIADAGGAITESDEGNNTRSLEVPVKPAVIPLRPNLIISELKVSPASPTQGSPATFSATVYNSGTATAPASKVQIWSSSGNLACTKDVPSLVAKGGQVITCVYTYASWSTYTVKAVADSTGAVTESDESDNTEQISVVVKKAP